MTALLSKIGIPLLFLTIGFSGGYIFKDKTTKPVDIRKIVSEEVAKIPKTECPEAVSLQTFDLEKLNNKKGNFSYSPQLSNVTIKIESKDSTLVKKILKAAK